ncbi:glycosyltransferase family protein [Pontibacter akesuensis]|uniref:CDP-Glycerol:Poly(Glycerophosphate) glycerophosphotransferase n=1 Tax=Pontibacter akesuensis TaxID=388950 RepID=A0A1I7FMY0_9BACT|nr:hypothetical protein [Pontibacter akesuensis]GHA61436.1 hypothetical protein GCM10007389_12320 [Pontibacter akesuensis]SFU37498.1 hypothetical protein SAMN04487941_0330 [Pontibacter akesuensis]
MKKWFALYSDILYLHFSEHFLQLPESAKNAYSPKNPLLRLLRMAGYTFLRLLGNVFKGVEHPTRLKGKVWLYVVSQNNYDSLHFLQQALPDAVAVAGQSKQIGKYNAVVERISLRRKLLYYYRFLPLFYHFLKSRKQATLRFYDVLYDAVGFYEIYHRKLQQYKPLAVVFANDHNADARAMLLAAKGLGIKTIYLQHASVSTLFPPLSFDLNLLEGQDSLNKYRQCGPIWGKVELVGMPKADKYIPFRNNSRHIRTIGIGCNIIDELSEIEILLRLLDLELPEVSILLRPHPREKRRFNSLKNISDRISLSDSRNVSAFEYLQQIDVQISATSGIHLEAVLLNVWSIYYDFSPTQNVDDYYGFIQNGLVDEVHTSEQLIKLIRTHLRAKPDVVERAQYYSATVATANDGRSSALALQHIDRFVNP